MAQLAHPAVLSRYRRIRRTTGILREVGELTAIEHLSRLDPHGLLSLAEEVGPEVARKRIEDPGTSFFDWINGGSP